MAREPDPILRETPMPDLDAAEDQITRVLGEDDGPPGGGQHGETHTKWAEHADGPKSQGRKTRAANRERVKGSPLHNPG